MNNQNTVMIVGAPRSGTTLLSGLITGSEKCFPNLPECTFITQAIKHYFDIVNYSDKERFSIYAKDVDTLSKVYRLHVDNMIDVVKSNFNNANYDFLVFKDPEISQYVDLIPNFFPQCKIVYIVRDPRAVISSMLQVYVKKGQCSTCSNGYFLDSTVMQVATEIYNYYHIIHTSQVFETGNVYVVSYEKLLDDRKHCLNGLECYLGYELSGDAFERNAFEFDHADPTFSENYGNNIVKPTSSFSDYLSPEQITQIKKMYSGLNITYNWWD
ncbi:sulfotransferase [Vibrio splendidus]